MAVSLLDSEFMEYWSKLSEDEKKSLLVAVKNFVASKEGEELHSDLRKSLILEEREAYLKGEGLSFSWDAVKKMAQDKSSRDAL